MAYDAGRKPLRGRVRLPDFTVGEMGDAARYEPEPEPAAPRIGCDPEYPILTTEHRRRNRLDLVRGGHAKKATIAMNDPNVSRAVFRE